MEWNFIIQQFLRDIVFPLFGAWVVYKQVYATNPNGLLLGVAFGCMFPAVRVALATLWSGLGSSSSSSPIVSEQSSRSSPAGENK